PPAGRPDGDGGGAALVGRGVPAGAPARPRRRGRRAGRAGGALLRRRHRPAGGADPGPRRPRPARRPGRPQLGAPPVSESNGTHAPASARLLARLAGAPAEDLAALDAEIAEAEGRLSDLRALRRL